jgi:DNA uptake protein ComE-like DNA-binding protein
VGLGQREKKSKRQPGRGRDASNRNMKRVLLAALGIVLLAGCQQRQQPSPDQIRQDTAKATHKAVQDAKAVGQGVVDGLKKSKTVNINTASADQLKGLPGIDDARARRIIANRPYDHANDLVKKGVVPQAEYDRISEQVDTK